MMAMICKCFSRKEQNLLKDSIPFLGSSIQFIKLIQILYLWIS